jgi:hypothetical protein
MITANRIGCADNKEERLYIPKNDWFYRQQTGYIVRTSNRIGSKENKQDRLYTVQTAKRMGCITRLVV